jgi:hypothetical protein
VTLPTSLQDEAQVNVCVRLRSVELGALTWCMQTTSPRCFSLLPLPCLCVNTARHPNTCACLRLRLHACRARITWQEEEAVRWRQRGTHRPCRG